MERRSFLKKASAGIAVGATATVASSVASAAPAVQTGLPEIKWRMASSFPKSLDTIYGGGEFVAKRVAELTSVVQKLTEAQEAAEKAVAKSAAKAVAKPAASKPAPVATKTAAPKAAEPKAAAPKAAVRRRAAPKSEAAKPAATATVAATAS